MASIAFVLPILPGKEDVDRETMERFATGDESEAFARSQRSHGVTRHAVWHQETPNGTIAIVLLEADDIERALAGSQEPFDQRFRELCRLPATRSPTLGAIPVERRPHPHPASVAGVGARRLRRGLSRLKPSQRNSGPLRLSRFYRA